MSSSSDSEAINVPPEVQQMASNIVSSLNVGNFESAVADLDYLLNVPGLSIDQRRAVRETMATVQKKLVTDPTISEEQKQRVRDVLAR